MDWGYIKINKSMELYRKNKALSSLGRDRELTKDLFSHIIIRKKDNAMGIV